MNMFLLKKSKLALYTRVDFINFERQFLSNFSFNCSEICFEHYSLMRYTALDFVRKFFKIETQT